MAPDPRARPCSSTMNKIGRNHVLLLLSPGMMETITNIYSVFMYQALCQTHLLTLREPYRVSTMQYFQGELA